MKITQIASMFQSSQISRYLRNCLSHSEALAEESICVTFPGSFAFAQDDKNLFNLKNEKIIAHKTMNGITIISESNKFRNSVRTRILLANAKKNID